MNRSEAFKKASAVVSISKFGGNWCVYSPWKGVDGPRTSTSHFYYKDAVKSSCAAKCPIAGSLLGIDEEDLMSICYDVLYNNLDWKSAIRNKLNGVN